MKNLKKITILVLLIIPFSISCFAAGSLTAVKNMLEICKQHVPIDSILVIYEKNEDETLITYLNEEQMTYYDFRFDMETLDLLDMKAQSSNIIGSTMMEKSEEDIENIVILEYPQAKNLKITTEKTGVNTCYKVTFSTDEYNCVLKLNPVTGAIGEREFSYIADPVTSYKGLNTQSTEF